MVSREARAAWLERIRANIDHHGVHVTLVGASRTPRFLYTIGLGPRTGAELIFAGGAWFSKAEAQRVVDTCAAAPAVDRVEVPDLGAFEVRPVHPSWVRVLLLGACDLYAGSEVRALQLVPEAGHWTVDVPDLSRALAPGSEPIWRYLTEPWDLPVGQDATAVTNLEALRGAAVTEAMRWELDQWELFAGPGPEVVPEEARCVPLVTLLGADPSLRAIVDLAVGRGLWREGAGEPWHDWGPGRRDGVLR